MCCIEISTLTFHCSAITCSLGTRLLCICKLGDIEQAHYALQTGERRRQGRRLNVPRKMYVIIQKREGYTEEDMFREEHEWLCRRETGKGS
jgi:hypothetical protein